MSCHATLPAYMFLVYFRDPDFKNHNHFFFYRANFEKSGIPVFSHFWLYIICKWPSCDLGMTLGSYEHMCVFRALNGEHNHMGYILVWDNLLVKQWSRVNQLDQICAFFLHLYDKMTSKWPWKNNATNGFSTIFVYIMGP